MVCPRGGVGKVISVFCSRAESFSPQNTGREESLAGVLTVHIFQKVVSRLSRRVGKQERRRAEQQTFVCFFSQKNHKVVLALFPTWFPQEVISFMLVVALHLYLRLQ